jgi:hypothetical protein
MIAVYLNGEKLIKGLDYTATATTVTFIGYTLVVDDVIMVEVLKNVITGD